MPKNNFTSNPLDEEEKKANTKKKQKIKGNYILEETIGEGAFAKVKLGKHIYTGEKVAIKILNKNKLFQDINESNSNDNILNDIKKIRKEINILKKLKHRNIIQLYEIMESKTNLYIIMEYCEGKELFDYIVNHKYLSEKEACFFFQQIIDGVEYLHLSKITHRDLKPENLLLDKNNRICISDFGLSTTSEEIDSLLETPCGTPSYAPPEMLRGDKYNGVLSDIWSCGIILYSMLVGSLPCAESKEELIYNNIMSHNYYFPDYISQEAIDLIENMLNINPNERFNFEQIKSHKWFNIIKPRLRPGIIFGVHKIPIDKKILEKVEEYGYDKKKCYESVKNNIYDTNSSIYYLLLKQSVDENKPSISDLFSDEYLKYIRDVNNWILPEKINDAIYKNYDIDSNNFNIFTTMKVYTINNYTMNNNEDFEAIPEESNKENESLNESYFNLNNNNNKKDEESKKIFFNNLTENNNNNIIYYNNKEIENEKKRVNILLKKNKDIKSKKERFIKSMTNDLKKRKTINYNKNKGKKNNNKDVKNKMAHKKIFSDIIKNIHIENNFNTEQIKSTIFNEKYNKNVNNSEEKKVIKKTPDKKLKILLKKKLLFYNTKNKNNVLLLQKQENKTIDNNLNQKSLYKTQHSTNNIKDINNMFSSSNLNIETKNIKTKKIPKSSDKKNSFKKNKNKNYEINDKNINSIQASPKRTNKYKNSIIKNFKSRIINKNLSDNLYNFCESEPKIVTFHTNFPSCFNNKNIYKSQNYLIPENNRVESLKEITPISQNKKKLICNTNINIENDIIINDNKIESLNDIIDNKKKLELLHKLETDEMQFEKALNLIDNIASGSTLSSINEIQNNQDKYNIINHFGEKIIKNSVFGKYLTNKNNVIINNINRKGEIEDNFYKLQKYKNIIGIVEQLKNKKFKNKLIDFNINSFDEYLNDEDDKIFSQSLLKTKGIEHFIHIIKSSLNKKDKNSKTRNKSFEQKNDIYKELKDNQIKFPTSVNSFYYRKKDKKNLGYQNIKNNNYDLNKDININSRYQNNNKSYSNKKISSKSQSKSQNKKSKKKDKDKNRHNKILSNINIRANKIKNISETDESSSNYNSNNSSINEEKKEEKEDDKNLDKKCIDNNNNENENKFIKQTSEKTDIDKEIDNNKFDKNNLKNILIDTSLQKYEINDIYKNKNGEIVLTPHLGIKQSPFVPKNENNNNNQNKNENNNNISNQMNWDTFNLINKNDKSINSNNEGTSYFDINTNSLNDISLRPKNINQDLCNTYTEGFYRSENKRMPIVVSLNNKNTKKSKRIETTNDKKKINAKIKYMYSYNNTINSSKKKNTNLTIKNNIPFRDLIINISKNKSKEKNKNIPSQSFYNSFYNTGHEDCTLAKEKSHTENNLILNKNINYNTINYFYTKNNNNSNNVIKNLKNIKEFTPLDLLCILDIELNNSINKTKNFFNKKGFLCIEKDNGLRIIKGNSIIEIKFCKITKNEEYFNIKIKSNDLRKDKNIIKKLLYYIENNRN